MTRSRIRMLDVENGDCRFNEIIDWRHRNGGVETKAGDFGALLAER